jgi:holo-[acyl-carrier protein] synthase
MILGIGMDVVEIARVERAATRYGERFLNRAFTPEERDCCSRKTRAYEGSPRVRAHAGYWESLAARFAVQEAAFKALGCGWPECGGFISVEVVSNAENSPVVVFRGAASSIAAEKGVVRVHVTITHDAGFAAAVVVLEG